MSVYYIQLLISYQGILSENHCPYFYSHSPIDFDHLRIFFFFFSFVFFFQSHSSAMFRWFVDIFFSSVQHSATISIGHLRCNWFNHVCIRLNCFYKSICSLCSSDGHANSCHLYVIDLPKGIFFRFKQNKFFLILAEQSPDWFFFHRHLNHFENFKKKKNQSVLYKEMV